jgi:hypothetical protein
MFETEDTLGSFFIRQEVSARSLDAVKIGNLKEVIRLASKNLWWIAVLRQKEDSPTFGDEYDHFKPNSLKNIIKRYYDLPTEERIKASLIEEIHTILNLPAWKHRWQLYQVWVGLYVLNRLHDSGLSLNVYVENSKIELYEHHPAQIADITGCKVPISYWAELQTAITAPDDKVNSIRPDYKLARSPVTNPENSLLLVEAKQRLNMPVPDIEKICKRYKQGCPNGVLIFVNYDAFPDMENIDSNVHFISQFRQGNNAAKRQVDECIDDIAIMIKNEQNIIAEEVRREREAEAHKEIRHLIQMADNKLEGVGFVGGFHVAHQDEKIGAIVLDCRTDKALRLFDGTGSSRDTVVQACRANPLAQVWLAGTTTPPKIAYYFDYEKNTRQLEQADCDIEKLIAELKVDVIGRILVIGYSSLLPHYHDKRVVLHGYVG